MQARPEDLDHSRHGRIGFKAAQDQDDPTGAERRTVWVVKLDLTQKMKHQPWVALNVDTAFGVLRSPARIYRGYRRSADDEWEKGYAYVGRPENYRTDKGDVLPLPPNRLYVTFVNERGDVTEWGKEECDPKSPDIPLSRNGSERFEEQIWPPTSPSKTS